MKNKFRSYGFWTALAGAVVVLINALGQAFGFSVDNEIVSNIIMAIAGVLVVFGVVSMPKEEGSEDGAEELDEKDEIQLDEQENIDKEDENIDNK